MNLALGPVMLVAVSLLLGGLMSLTLLGFLLPSRQPRPPAESPDGTVVAAPER